MSVLRRLGYAVLVLTAVCAITATSAMAKEAGILPLKELASGIKLEKAEGGEVTFTGGTSKKQFKCGEIKVDEGLLGGLAGEGLHIILGKGVLHLLKCTFGASECSTEEAGKKDPAGTFLIPVDFHFLNLLNNSETELEAGLAMLLLKTVIIICAPLKFELKGVFKGLVLDETGKLVKDTTLVLVDFVNAGEKCDTKEPDELCKKLDAEPPLMNFGKGFERLELSGQLHVTVSEELMFLVDD